MSTIPASIVDDDRRRNGEIKKGVNLTKKIDDNKTIVMDYWNAELFIEIF